ncbi:response regulator transcription factor [Streptomyces celluloflavus]|uniref:response regulator transcription factor n=1 Tax=Streptomyces celluloflavus TaxID=58344 RepID=UPI0036DC66C3
MCARVVVAEDDRKQAALVRRYLEHEGHDVVVVRDGATALAELRRRLPDLLILDVMMPFIDGFDVCRTVRAEAGLAALPVLMLTARSTVDDQLLGLDLGADAYLSKPSGPRELMARARSLLRRGGREDADADAAVPDPVLRVGPLTVDPGRHEVWAHDRRVHCTPGEFRLLEVLASRPGQVFSRTQILERLHGADCYISARTVDMHVMNLRKKIEQDPRSARRLVTVYGFGYKLVDQEQPAGRENPGPATGRRDARHGP